jgi:hypothetical protein
MINSICQFKVFLHKVFQNFGDAFKYLAYRLLNMAQAMDEDLRCRSAHM